MEKEKLRQIIYDQQEQLLKKDHLIEREIPLENYLKGNEIVVITGIRRCGKSSLLKIILTKLKEKFIYISFDDIRFTDFNTENFEDIDELILEMLGTQADVVYFLDEVQNVPSWERWVNNLYAKNKKVFVTGSNSSLLSSEISTFLTGRNKIIKLYPFSFKEFLAYRNIKTDYKTTSEKIALIICFKEYFENGGFPLVIKNNDLDLSRQYFEDIIKKDIISRYKIKKIKEFNDLVVFLFSNVGKIYSYSTLKQVSGIKSLSMIKNYIEYLKNVFIALTINRFDYSVKKQKVSSSKFYSLDNSFLKTIAFNFSENLGQRLENLVFIELVRRGFDIYYHNEKNECDFVIKEGLKIKQAIQVCLDLSNPETKERELKGIFEALNIYKLKEGLILTMNEENSIVKGDKKIIILPIWKWLLQNK